MARIFITGSADGLGQMAARLMIGAGHHVVLHARSVARAGEAMAKSPGAADAVVGDLATIDACRRIADEVNTLGRFDAVIHNAAVGYRDPRRIATVDGMAQVFAINTLAPYILTALIERPARLVYLSSGMHRGADASLDDLNWERRRWNGSDAYADSKLHDAILAMAIARLWPDVLSNAVDPGWVATKMGGAGAPGNLAAGPVTQAWLATSNDPAAMVSGRFFHHQQQRAADPACTNVEIQDRLLAACAKLSGVALPGR